MDIVERRALLLRLFELLTTLVSHYLVLRRCARNRRLARKREMLRRTAAILARHVAETRVDIGISSSSRKCWMLKRSSDWWDSIATSNDDRDWLTNFGMTKPTFERLVDVLRNDLMPGRRPVRTPIPLEKRIAVALYKLSSDAEYKVVGELFGVHKTSVHRCLHRFCQALCNKITDFIFLPSSSEASQMANATYDHTGFPQVFSAIGGCHIKVTAPKSGKKDFINGEMFPSLVLQAVVDHKYRFRDISAITPGSVHNPASLHYSNLYKNPEDLPQGTIQINNVDIPLLLAGDDNYPMLPFLVRPYSGTALTAQQECFNEHHSRVRTVVGAAFERLKARWGILKGQLDVNLRHAPTVIEVCCILHNLCEMCETPLPEGREEVQIHEVSVPLSDDPADSVVRSAIAEYLYRRHACP